MTDAERRLAERVRSACIDAALKGYEEAAISGLCSAGAWEAAIGAMRMLDIAVLVAVTTGAADQTTAADDQPQ